MARIKKLAEWQDRDHPSAATSLLEGLKECFTINRLGVPPLLRRCLATTNIVESPRPGVRILTLLVTHRQSGKMVIRWLASAFIRTEEKFNKIIGYRDLWTLDAILNDTQPAAAQVAAKYHQPNRLPPLSTTRGTYSLECLFP
jgi:putative transposase